MFKHLKKINKNLKTLESIMRTLHNMEMAKHNFFMFNDFLKIKEYLPTFIILTLILKYPGWL